MIKISKMLKKSKISIHYLPLARAPINFGDFKNGEI